MLYYLPTYLYLCPTSTSTNIYAECLKCKTQHSSAAVSSACFSSFSWPLLFLLLAYVFDMYSLTCWLLYGYV